MRTTVLYMILGIVLATYSCGGNVGADVDKTKEPIVSVKSNTLYRAELEAALPLDIKGDDSIKAAQLYIDMWVNDQLMYDKARSNTMNKDEIEELVENYKKTLVTKSYQEQLIKEHFYKSVSDADLQSFYEQNKERLTLEESLVKGLFLKVPIGSKMLNNFQKWYRLGTEVAIENIEKNTLQNVAAYEYFYDRWVPFDEVMENIPSQISNEAQFLQANKNMEVRDTSFVYLLNIKEYKLAGTKAPYEYIKGQLSEMFIEQRKKEYLKQVQKDLYDKAISDDEIKFYNR